MGRGSPSLLSTNAGNASNSSILALKQAEDHRGPESFPRRPFGRRPTSPRRRNGWRSGRGACVRPADALRFGLGDRRIGVAAAEGGRDAPSESGGSGPRTPLISAASRSATALPTSAQGSGLRQRCGLPRTIVSAMRRSVVPSPSGRPSRRALSLCRSMPSASLQ